MALSTYLSLQRMLYGDINKEAIFNALLDDYDRRVGNNPLVALYHNTAQAIATGTWATLAFNSETEDTEGMHDTVTNNSRATIRTAGRYAGQAIVPFENNSGGTYRVARAIYNGGSTNIISIAQVPPVGSSKYTALALPILPRLYAVNDYVEVQAGHDVGSSINLLYETGDGYITRFALWRVG